MLTLPLQAHHAMEKMEEFVYKVWELPGIPGGNWRLCSALLGFRGSTSIAVWAWELKCCRWFAGCLCSALVLMVTMIGKCTRASTALWPARLPVV